ncbi:fibrobacter succinogenes major paralogous domain-containing protein [bacterium]|nr:fibrobacter succinogenes major paralogous domain-containing protein [bacterium]
MTFTTSCKNDDPKESVDTDIDDNIDIDGNVYNTITIGTQVWMVENLKTTRYRNGEPIPNVTDNSAWATSTQGAQCSYNNNVANDIKYGKLYNWYAVNDSRKLAPKGWHIPSEAEWTTLINYITANLGISASLAKALAAKTDWSSSTEVGAVGNDLSKNNSSGFTALPGGFRGVNGPSGVFGWFRDTGCFWTANGLNESWGPAAASRFISSSSDKVQTGAFFRSDGLSVRCIKD